MTLREYLAGQQSLVDAELDRLVPPEATVESSIAALAAHFVQQGMA